MELLQQPNKANYSKAPLQKHLIRQNQFLRTVTASIYPFPRILLLFVLTFLLAANAYAKQTVLLPYLKHKNDRILFKLLRYTNDLIEYDRLISSKWMTCVSPIENELTKNKICKIQRLATPISIQKQVQIEHKFQSSLEYTNQEYQLRKYDRILDMLNGTCLYYRTWTFIYEYCHKHHVRQFDNDFTKANNQKPAYEDILMGTYHYEEYKQRKKEVEELNAQLGIDISSSMSPQPEDFNDQYIFEYAHAIDGEIGFTELQESEDGNYVSSNSHLVGTQLYLNQFPIFIELICQQKIKETDSEQAKKLPKIINYALIVSPYEMIYTYKTGSCDNLLNYKVHHSESIFYSSALQNQSIRVFRNYVYGKVEERCGKNWAWERRRQGKLDMNNHLEEGSLLLLEYYDMFSNFKTNLVKVVKVISSDLIQIDSYVGSSFKIVQNKKDLFFFANAKNVQIHNITSCEIISKKQLNYSSVTINNKYLNKNLMIVNETRLADRQQKSFQGSNLGCICESSRGKSIKYVDLDVTVGKKLWLNYYETYVESNTMMHFYFKEKVLDGCNFISCFEYLNKKVPQQKQKPQGKFTQIKKLLPKDKFLKVESQENKIFVINLLETGLMRLKTKNRHTNETFQYYLSEGQLLKIKYFPNGSKSIEKQNKFYQNLTNPNQQSYRQFIYIYVTKLKNGQYIGGIWKFLDRVIFPRFLLYAQQLLEFQLLEGFGYIRILEIQKMKRPNSLAITKIAYLFENHLLSDDYQTLEQYEAFLHINQELGQSSKQEQLYEPIFPKKSVSVSYAYQYGDFCPHPIGKNRKTVVTIKCGKSWFEITKLHETKPCEYYFEIESRMLCEDGYKNVVNSDEQIPSKDQDDVVIFNGVMCYPFRGAFNRAQPYYYFGKEFHN